MLCKNALYMYMNKCWCIKITVILIYKNYCIILELLKLPCTNVNLWTGYQVNVLDLAPQYAHIVTGFTRISCIGSVLSTLVAGSLRQEVENSVFITFLTMHVHLIFQYNSVWFQSVRNYKYLILVWIIAQHFHKILWNFIWICLTISGFLFYSFPRISDHGRTYF